MATKPSYDHHQTLWQVFARGVQAYPDRTALVVGEARPTYRQLHDRAVGLAAALYQRGVRPGDKLAVVVPGSEAFVLGMLAAARLAAVFVPVNPQLRPHELRYILDDAEVVAVVVAERMWGGSPLKALMAAREELPRLRHVVVAGEPRPGADAPAAPDLNPSQESVLRLADLIATPPAELPPPAGNPDDLAALIYTSGTTGAPKGSMHTHSTLLFPGMALQRYLDEILSHPGPLLKAVAQGLLRYPFRLGGLLRLALKQPMTTLSPLPPHTTAGFVVVLGCLMNGNPLVLMERFVPAEALRLIEQERVHSLVAVPTIMAMLLRVPDFEHYDLRSLLYCTMGAAPVPPALAEQIEKRIGCAVVIGFGTTEVAGAIVGTNPFLDPRNTTKETVGKLSPAWEARIVDDQRRPLPTGQVGELALRGDSLMKGYYKAPELTSQTIDAEGWYYTGDLATIDAQGFIRIVGRKKDMIIRAGQNIYPAELEAVLAAHPQIHQAAVIGLPTPDGDERVLACVVPATDAGLSSADVLDYCRRELAPYKVPDEVRFVPELPMNPAGKVQKFILREMMVNANR